MGFHIVDIVIVSLVLFLAIKGLVNGFSKELFNFITIVGGVAVAARFNTTIIDLINEQKIVPTISESYAKIIGFIVIIVAIWLVIGLISSIITKLTSENTSIVSRILGYILSAARYLFIFSLIVFGVNQSDFFKNEAEKLKTETKLFVPMAKVGATLLNMDANTSKTEASVEENKTPKIENNSTIISVEMNTTDVNFTSESSTPSTEHNNSH